MWRSALLKPVRHRSVAPYLIVLAVMLIIPRAGGAVPDRRASTTVEFSTECQAAFNQLLQELAVTLSRSLSLPTTPLIGAPLGLDNLSMKRMRFTVDALFEPLLSRLSSFHKLGTEAELRVELNGTGAIFELLFPEGVDICAELTPQPGIQAMQNGNGLQAREPQQDVSSDGYEDSKEALRELGKGIKTGLAKEIDELKRGLAEAAGEWFDSRWREAQEYLPDFPWSGGGPSDPSTPGGYSGGGEPSPFFQGLSFKTNGRPWDDDFMVGFQCSVYQSEELALEAVLLAALASEDYRTEFKATYHTDAGPVSLKVIETSERSAVTFGVNLSF